MKAQSQRQLRAGELVRRALADIIAEGAIHDPAVAGVPVTVTEARMSPDLRHATVFVAAMGQPTGQSWQRRSIMLRAISSASLPDASSCASRRSCDLRPMTGSTRLPMSTRCCRARM